MRFLLALFCASQLSAQSLPGWTLVWSDEFEQANGSAPDSSKWGYDLGGGGWGNSELQYYTNSTNNSRIENGELIIEAREQNLGGYGYTSARLLSKGKFDQTYGRFEARIKVPSGSGLWPAFWMLGNDIDTVGWPHCGEIDIMEFVGREPNEVFGTIHGPGYSGGDSFGDTHTFTTPVPNDYHTYVVEWEPSEIRWYVDDIHYHSANPSDVAPNNWPFDHPHFLILNLAIGGNFGGPVDPALSFPKQMLVDYVRVYEEGVQLNPQCLENIGFESDQLSPWIGYSDSGVNELGGYIESSSNTYYNSGNPGGDNVMPRSGDYVAKVFGDFNGAENYNGFYQEKPATPDSKWLASGWAMSHLQDLISGTNKAWLEITFRDDSNNILGLSRSDILTSTSVVASQWTELPVTTQYNTTTFAPIGPVSELIAPAGTTTIRLQVVFQQELYDGGSVYFDDFSLIELSQIVEGVLKVTGNLTQVFLDFDTTAGDIYEIHTSADLSDGSWNFVESITGTGSPVSRSYPLPDNHRFYRLHIATN